MHALRLTAVMLLAAIAAGCATPMQMGLTRDTKELDTSKESLVLLSAELVNRYKPDYQPNAFMVQVEKPDAKEAADRLNFLADDEGRSLAPGGNQFLFRMAMPPGRYIVRGIMGFSGNFPVRGNFFVPLHMDIEVTPRSVLYLGRVNAIMRERGETEFRAGAPIPLIDQAVTGFAGGTWDVETRDNSHADVPAMRRVFPALQKVDVRTTLLPRWDRAKAQDWWEKN